MHLRLFAIISCLALVGSACSLTETLPPPSRTPRPTITPTRTVVETLVPLQTDLPLATVTDSALTPTGPGQTATLRPTLALPTSSAEPSLTPTRRPAVIQPLTVTNIQLVGVERDPTRENGALASIQVIFSGGRAPFRIFHDDTLQPNNPFIVLTLCHGTLVHTIRVTSGDKQVVTKQYYLSPVDCPP